MSRLGAGLVWAALLWGAVPCAGQEGGDLQARIVYAYQSEDTNQLLNLIQNLANQIASGDADAALRYHLAHAQYRYGLLAETAKPKAAARAFADCIDQLKLILDRNAKSVEALALQSACYSRLAGHRHLEAVLLRSRAEERLRTALELAPRNPRVLYLAAMEGLARSKRGSPENERAFDQLRQAAQLFDQSSATRDEVPGWGHAEAYLALGIELEAGGDVLGARNWLEKSLLAAPDYKAAQRQMAALAAQPR